MEKKIYNTKSEKTGDFISGFVLGLIISITVGTVSFVMAPSLNMFSRSSGLGVLVIPILTVILLAVVVVYLIGRKRRYMGIGFLFGALTIIVACLLLLGTCILALKGVIG